MAVIQNIITAQLWQHDFAALADPCRRDCLFRDVRDAVSGKWITASLILPGDSLLLLRRALIGKGVMDFAPTMNPHLCGEVSAVG